MQYVAPHFLSGQGLVTVDGYVDQLHPLQNILGKKGASIIVLSAGAWWLI
jgi:hypothetical protein